jgi:hypothetical protein
MQLVRARAIHCLDKQRLAGEFAAGNELIDPRDVHLDDAAGPDVKMSHFAVAHLAFGKSDGRSRCLDERVREFLEQTVVIRFAGECDGVPFRFGPITPAIEYGQHDRFRTLCHCDSGASNIRDFKRESTLAQRVANCPRVLSLNATRIAPAGRGDANKLTQNECGKIKCG